MVATSCMDSARIPVPLAGRPSSIVAPVRGALAASWPALADLPLEPARALGARRGDRPRLRGRAQSGPRPLGQSAAPRARDGRSTSGRAGTATGTCGSPSPAMTGRRDARVLPALSAPRRRARPRARRPVPARRARRLPRSPARPRSCSCTASCGDAVGAADARRTVLYLALFPDVACSSGRSTESRSSSRSRWRRSSSRSGGASGWAAVAAGLALLTRAQGVALLPALAVFAWRSERRRRDLALLARSGRDVPRVPADARGLRSDTAWRSSTRSASGSGRSRRSGRSAGSCRRSARATSSDRPSPSAWSASRCSRGDGSVRRTACTRSRALGDPDGTSLRAARRPLLVPALRARRLFRVSSALAILGRDRRIHVAAVAVLGAALAVNVVRWALWYWVA